MKKYFVRCSSQNNQNTTLKIEAESEDAAREIAIHKYKVNQVFNISEENNKVPWGKRKCNYHIIERKGKYIKVFC